MKCTADISIVLVSNEFLVTVVVSESQKRKTTNPEGKTVSAIGVSCGTGCVTVEMSVVCGVKATGIVISENGV